ncbi:signal peptide peptidase SppA [Ideonella paludis]|uniref:Signal peptide peptidase SppA n=1 Tax=Ideonella paludis TaxID=1233411 RepID=A0ABS5E1V3_9BURK|nr:signal peptide peptidase SppA [Ideonella paludis]MBQ0937279.1 signal peptide peptidase SppA [Ideonella paludis]
MSFSSIASPFVAVFKGIWWFLDLCRRAFFNLIILLVLIAIAVALFTSKPDKPKDKTTLVLNLQGKLVEEVAGSPREHLLAGAQGEMVHQTRLRDVLTALKEACKDPNISQAVLDVSEFEGAGMAQLREVGTALTQFKACNKPLLSYGEHFSQAGYYLASHANEVNLHPMGMVELSGFGRQRNYYKDALDRLGITVHLLRVGTFKSFGEPYIANAPSKAALEADAYLYDALWADYMSSVEAQRKLPAGSITQLINTLPEALKATGGDGAKLALNAKLVDAVITRDLFREKIIKGGALDDKTIRQVSLADYARQAPQPSAIGPAVGVVVAEGEIIDGFASPGTIGGDSTARLIRQVREDERIKAVVVRVNSPGGSALASEIVRRELEVTRTAGKPVVISMGDVAASGGYWISMSSDRVLADKGTITGSIGVFGMLPTAEGLMDKLSIRTGGYSTTWLAGGYDPRRALDPRMAEVVQSGINDIYTRFIGQAAAARKMKPEALDAVAQGRVWTGQQAKERGLVDELGGLQDAITAATSLAKLDKPAVVYVEPERSRFDRLLASLGDQAAVSIAPLFQSLMGSHSNPLRNAAAWATRQDQGELALARKLIEGRQPYAAAVHCLCTAP